MARPREIFQRDRALFGTVPPVTESFVCDLCLGPVSSGFSLCIGCERLSSSGTAVPEALRTAVVPMTTALNPSPWYSRLVSYKTVRPEHQTSLAALVFLFLQANRARVSEILGGPVDCITVVPSKRGTPYERQPLRTALALVGPLEERIVEGLRFQAGADYRRQRYDPAWYQPGASPPVGQRVVLIEDTWVSGATCFSAAGALLALGAVSVAVLPIARCVDEGFWSTGAPEYLKGMKAPYDLRRWPR